MITTHVKWESTEKEHRRATNPVGANKVFYEVTSWFYGKERAEQQNWRLACGER